MGGKAFKQYNVLNPKPVRTGNPSRDTMANCEDPDEMKHNTAFHQDLHCLLRQNLSSEKETQFEILTCDPLVHVYTIDHPDIIACSCMEISIGLKRVLHIG